MRRVRHVYLVLAAAFAVVFTFGSSSANALDIPGSSGVGGYAHITNGRSDLCLAVPGGSMEPAAQLNQFTCGEWDDHFWVLQLAFTTDNGSRDWYTIQNQNSGMCLSVDAARKDNFAPVTQYPCGWPAAYVDQYWALNGKGMIENGKAIEGWGLENYNSRKCLAIKDGSTASTAPAVQYDCGWYGDQIWY